jgi:zinc protease
VRVVSFVCAALGAGSLVSACGAPPAVGVPALAGTALPAVVDGRKTRLTFTLPNGVTAILEENHVTPVVALQAWIAAGSAAEEAGQGGLAHLTERVVLAGARADADPAPLTAWTSFDEAVFETVVATPFASARLDALGAMLARGVFDGADIERARAQVVGELHRAAASPAAVARDALFAAAFRGHGYGRPVLGDEATLRALTAADVTAFHARAYAGARVTLVAVGDFDARALRERVAAAFAALPKGRPASDAPVDAATSPAVVVAAGDEGDGHLAVGFRFSARDAAAVASVDVLAATLARGEDGRLARELVRNRQLARDVRASVFRGVDGGLLAVDITLVSGRVAEASRVVLEEVARARRELAPAELEGAAAAVEADLARAQETPAGYARKLGLSQLIAGTPTSEDRYLGALRGLTPEDVRGATEPLVLPSAIAVAVAVPGGARRDLAAELDAVVAGLAVKPARRVESRAVTSEGGVVRVVLPSGVRVLVLRDPSAASVAVHAVWSGGLRLEDARSNGVTGLLAAALPRGTRTRDATRLAADLDALGGTLSASAGRDELGVAATFLARRWEAGLALLADCLRHPAFDEAEVEVAVRGALERVRDHEDDADVAAARLYAATLWPGHPYRLPLLGTASSLSGLTRRRLVDHFQAHYGAANLTIAVVGDVDAGRVVEELRDLFADAPPALVPPPPAATPPARAADAPTEVFAVAAGDQAHVIVGYPGVSLGDPDRRAADVLVEILGGRQEARDGRLARDLAGRSLVGASAWSGLEGGALVFDLASTPANLDDAVVALRAALGRVNASPFSAVEVERARAALASADARALGSRGAVAAALARDAALGLGTLTFTFRGAAAALAAVTPDAVARVAHRLLDPRLEIVAVARPPLAPTIAKTTAPKALPRATPTAPSHSGGRRPPAP